MAEGIWGGSTRSQRAETTSQSQRFPSSHDLAELGRKVIPERGGIADLKSIRAEDGQLEAS